jgi:hypothetical protein
MAGTARRTVWPAAGRFPLLAKFARPAAVDPDSQNQIGLAERKVMTVDVATATDAMQRSIIGFGDGVGLRAGTFHTDYGAAWTTTLADCAFAKDVTVNGAVTWKHTAPSWLIYSLADREQQAAPCMSREHGKPPARLATSRSAARSAAHPLSAPRCRGGIRPMPREVQGRQRSARNRNPPNVDRRKGTGQVANRRVPKHQDLRSPSRSPSCNLVGKLRPQNTTLQVKFSGDFC